MDLTFLSGVFASPWNIFLSLLDISIVAYIFYRLLGVIRGTRAEQLLKGLVILLVFSAGASYLRLDMVNWLLEKLWILFAITLPIVFQPELRRVLEQLGRGSFFAGPAKISEMEEYEGVIVEISRAVSNLSRDRIGALIVLSRETGIGEYLESGIGIDSLVSASLLLNIFVPNTPLHDGAVVIKDGRLQRAACFLPLSNNPFIDHQLGTRHRAALGISEVSDALAIVVSEETGAISLAREGRLERFADASELRAGLERELMAGLKKRESFWRRWSGETDDNGKEKKDLA